MSLLALMAASAAPSPVDPPVSDNLNLAYEGPQSASMRPDWDRVIRVGPSRAHKTIPEAVTHARATAPYGKVGAGVDPALGNIPYRGGRPYYARTLLLLDPGTYQATLDLGDWIDVMGNGNTRADVVIESTGTVQYPLRFYGSMFAANLTFKHSSTSTANNYPMHGSTIHGTAGHFTAVFDNVHFHNTNPAAFGIAGWDMPNGMRAYLYRCRFEDTSGADKGIIFHDMPGNTLGAEATFINCQMPEPIAAKMYVQLISAEKIGRTIRYGATSLDGTTSYPNMERVNTEAEVAYTGPEPTIPAGSMTTSEQDKYLPVTSGQTLTPAYGTTSTAEFPADRAYLVPLPPLTAAQVLKSVEVAATTAGNGVSVDLYVQNETGKPSRSLLWSTVSTTGTISKAVAASDYFFLERGTRFWLGVRVAAGAPATLAASTTLAGQEVCYYVDAPGLINNSFAVVDTTTLVQVPAGQPVPAPVVKT